MVMVIVGFNYTGSVDFHRPCFCGQTMFFRPRTNEVTLSILSRAKTNGFTALVVTLDTMLLGWRPHDLERAYLPFGHGVGIEVGRSDPVFMGRFNRQPILDNHPEFPYDSVAKDKAFLAGDEKTKDEAFLGVEWLKEANSGVFRNWDDLKWLRQQWDGPLVLKGIQSVQVRLSGKMRDLSAG
jgi:lactate 2-monooxygenase